MKTEIHELCAQFYSVNIREGCDSVTGYCSGTIEDAELLAGNLSEAMEMIREVKRRAGCARREEGED